MGVVRRMRGVGRVLRNHSPVRLFGHDETEQGFAGGDQRVGLDFLCGRGFGICNGVAGRNRLGLCRQPSRFPRVP